MAGPLRERDLWQRPDAAGVRRAKAAAVPLVFWRHPDSAQTLAHALPARLAGPPAARLGRAGAVAGAALSLSDGRTAMVQRRADLRVHLTATRHWLAAGRRAPGQSARSQRDAARPAFQLLDHQPPAHALGAARDTPLLVGRGDWRGRHPLEPELGRDASGHPGRLQ